MPHGHVARAANSVDFYIEFTLEFEFSSFYEFEFKFEFKFNILIYASLILS